MSPSNVSPISDRSPGAPEEPGGEKLSISVALATYNGAKFLQAQLESMAAQTRLPDEIVVGDDRSSDETLSIIERFAEESGLTLRIEVNPERLGSTKNFEEIALRCSGDVIVFSDQDDLWREDKLEKIEAALLANPAAPYVFSDAALIDHEGRRLEGSLLGRRGFAKAERALYRSGGGFDVLLRHDVVNGATMAVRKAALSPATPFVDDVEFDWWHDNWLFAALESSSHGILIDEPLISYRIHPKQQTRMLQLSMETVLAALDRRDESYFAREAQHFRILLDRLEDRAGLDGVRESLRKKVAFCERRGRMRTEPWLAPPRILVSWLAGDYRRYTMCFEFGRVAFQLAPLLDLAAAMRLMFGRRSNRNRPSPAPS